MNQHDMILADDMKVQLENQNGFCMNVKVGFSWTTLFFAFLPAVFRKDFKWAGLQVLAAGFSMGLSCLIFPFIYNRLYIKDLLQKGYLPVTPDAENVLTGKKNDSLIHYWRCVKPRTRGCHEA